MGQNSTVLRAPENNIRAFAHCIRQCGNDSNKVLTRVWLLLRYISEFSVVRLFGVTNLEI